jgi:hypothetical protein
MSSPVGSIMSCESYESAHCILSNNLTAYWRPQKGDTSPFEYFATKEFIKVKHSKLDKHITVKFISAKSDHIDSDQKSVAIAKSFTKKKLVS